MLGDGFDAAQNAFEVALTADEGEHASPEGTLDGWRHAISSSKANDGCTSWFAGGVADDAGRCAGNGVGVGARVNGCVGGSEAAKLHPDGLGLGSGEIADQRANCVVILHGNDNVGSTGH